VTGVAAPARSTVGSPETSRVGIWVTRALAVVLGSYALLSCWALFYNVSPIAAASACVFGSAAVGLWLMRAWSRWIVYSISTAVCVWFAWYVSKLVQGGWPYDDVPKSAAAVLPASLLLLSAIAAAAHVRRFFNPRSSVTALVTPP
jgi:hypothetical protein